MSTEIKIITGRLAAIKLNVNIWSGRKKLRPEDLKGAIKLPPEKLASLGHKKVVDPERINVFHRLKKEAERVCLQTGTRFLGGFAIPDGKLPEAVKELDRIRAEFLHEKEKFLSEYGQAVDEWAERYPDFQSIIRSAVDPVERVRSAIDFDYVVFRVEPHPRDQGTLEKTAGHLGHGVLAEVAKEAENLLDSILGRDQVSRRVLNPLRRIRDKLDGFSFIDPSFGPIVDSIDRMLMELGKGKAPIQGRDLDRLLALVQILSDPDKARKHGKGLLSLSDFMPLPPASEPGPLFFTEEEDAPEPAPEKGESGDDSFQEEQEEPEVAEDFWF